MRLGVAYEGGGSIGLEGITGAVNTTVESVELHMHLWQEPCI